MTLSNLLRSDPFRELEEMSQRLNRFLIGHDGKTSEAEETLTMADWSPSVDVSETETEFKITAELPGIQIEDLKVTLEQGVLTLEGERRNDQQAEGHRLHRTELPSGRFFRSFTVPDVVESTNIRAELKDGLLHIHLKKSEDAKRKAIEVQIV